MALAVTIVKIDSDTNSTYVLGTIAASGNYAAGGDTLSFANPTNPKGGTLNVQSIPRQVWIQSQASGGGSGWIYSFRPGTTIANAKMQVFGQQPTSATAGVIPLSELAAAAYPASITGDTIVFEAIFDKQL